MFNRLQLGVQYALATLLLKPFFLTLLLKLLEHAKYGTKQFKFSMCNRFISTILLIFET